MSDNSSPFADRGFIDAHVHLWDTRVFPLPWLAPDGQLAQVYRRDDLVAASGCPPSAVIAVQAGGSQTEAAWLLELARRDDGPCVRVVAQHSPGPDSPNGALPLLDEPPSSPLAGVRIPVHRLDEDWTDLDGLDAVARHLERSGRVLEVLLRPDQVGAIEVVAARFPKLSIVLCHLGLGSAVPDLRWRQVLGRVAASPRVFAKISGLFGSSHGVEAARGAIQFAMDQFGPDRLLFGSDWPMCARYRSYSDVLELTADALGRLTSTESDAVWRGTATRLYGLGADAGADLAISRSSAGNDA